MVVSNAFLRAHLSHHARFYGAVLVGVAVYFLLGAFEPAARTAAAGDAFFLTYLVSTALLVLRLDAAGLQRRAGVADEGGFVVILIALAVIVLCVVGVFTVLHQKQISPLTFALAAASAPLGWFTLHTIAAFRYANHHFVGDAVGKGVALKFPGTKDPEISDFLYFALVVGMTAQVSDVQVMSPSMRRLTIVHSVVSFFFNTVLIAMAVNAVVAAAS